MCMCPLMLHPHVRLDNNKWTVFSKKNNNKKRFTTEHCCSSTKYKWEGEGGGDRRENAYRLS